MQVAFVIPPGTPFMAHVEVVTTCLNPCEPELCPACGHATVWRFAGVALHDDGAVALDPTTVCGSEECWRDEPEE